VYTISFERMFAKVVSEGRGQIHDIEFLPPSGIEVTTTRWWWSEIAN
jgi:hypothetical protein